MRGLSITRIVQTVLVAAGAGYLAFDAGFKSVDVNHLQLLGPILLGMLLGDSLTRGTRSLFRGKPVSGGLLAFVSAAILAGIGAVHFGLVQPAGLPYVGDELTQAFASSWDRLVLAGVAIGVVFFGLATQERNYRLKGNIASAVLDASPDVDLSLSMPSPASPADVIDRPHLRFTTFEAHMVVPEHAVVTAEAAPAEVVVAQPAIRQSLIDVSAKSDIVQVEVVAPAEPVRPAVLTPAPAPFRSAKAPTLKSAKISVFFTAAKDGFDIRIESRGISRNMFDGSVKKETNLAAGVKGITGVDVSSVKTKGAGDVKTIELHAVGDRETLEKAFRSLIDEPRFA